MKDDEALLTLAVAKDCLYDAKALLDIGRYRASVSRSYYAIFHAAKAALISMNVEAYTHQGVNIQFGKIFIKSGIFDKSLIRTFSKMLDTRLKADYEIGFKASQGDAQDAFSEAELFYSKIADYLLVNY